MTIYCIGRNYRAHAQELGNPIPDEEPLVFLKSDASLRGMQASPLAFADEEFHHEVELVLKIASRVSLGSLAGWAEVSHLALGLDITRRVIQQQLKAKGHPWTTAKSFAGSAIVAPWVPIERFPRLEEISFSLEVEHTLRQHGQVKDMLFSVPALLSYLASLQELRPGDIVFTGTPAGVGPIRRGQHFRLAFAETELAWDGVF